MDLRSRISAFSVLGEHLRDILNGMETENTARLSHLIITQQLINPWFTPENVRMAIGAIAEELTQENLEKWCSAYPALATETKPLKIGVVMAGNIPLVGFHDFLSVLISGNSIIARTSSKDRDLINELSRILCTINSEFTDLITLTEGTISGFDAVIATGSDNTARYFEYYFGKYPHIIRKNRNSIALIDGSETTEELQQLGNDIFSYFGLGCRNVSKIYVPERYDFRAMISSWDQFSPLINHNKYANNYDYNKAIFLVNNEKFKDTGYLLLRESTGLASPVAVLYYEYYKSQKDFIIQSEQNRDKIQCIVGRNHIQFGKSQMPALWDYADRIDTIEFLLKKNSTGIL